MKFLKRWKFWKRMILGLIVIPVILFFTVVLIVYWKQDAIVQEILTTMNEDFKGEIVIEDSHVSPFANFPYISIDLDHVQIYEDKTRQTEPLLDIADIYVGFDLWTLLSGNYQIKSIKAKEGYIHVVQHADGEINLLKALETEKEIEDPEEEFHLDLRKIELINIDIYKLNEANGLMVEAFIDEAELKFKSVPDHTYAYLNSDFQLNVIDNGDTTFFKHKHFSVHTEMDYLTEEELMIVKPSEIQLEKASFNMEGKIDFNDDFFVDLLFSGEKPNFDLFMAFAPEELIPTLEQYDNAGKIYFDARVTGKSANGHTPLIDATFGCEDAYFQNTNANKKLDDLNFVGHFTNGADRNLTSSEFSLTNFSARPEAGVFSANLIVQNFESPEIDLTVDSDFDLDFLAKFLNITNLRNLTGKVSLSMKFKDIIDLSRPERSIEEFNKSYFSELRIENLSFTSPDLHLPVKRIDTKITVDGNAAHIEHFKANIGKSDLFISGNISDLPAIIHHTKEEVISDLTITSKLLDLEELTSYDPENHKPVDEQIEDLSLKFKFISSAQAITESPNLPVGEFFVEDLYAKLKHYPHTLHDFHADLFIENEDFRIVDFSGMIDKSDFHFNGALRDYSMWMSEEPLGDTRVEFDLTSAHLQLEDLFSYQGENYVPEDYRHEELSQLKIHGIAELHFNQGLKSTDLYITEVDAKMKVHPMKFENFNGRIHLEDEHLVLEKLKGKIGKSEFTVDLNYYLGEDESIKKRDNHFGIRANRLDFDELFNYTPGSEAHTPEEHEAVFNIYDLPFTDMTFDLDIHHLNYHRYLLTDFKGAFRTTPDHYIYVDTLKMGAAGGKISLSGYFNGSDKTKIYFSPNMRLEGVDLDKLLFKFENFGQDHIVSENLHGKLFATITGKIHMHPDLIPIIDDSEIHMDVTVYNGRLENYAVLVALGDYFKDKNVSKVYFDTLSNHIDLTNGVMTIPNMTINTSLGFMQISGTQDMDYNMEYYVRIPLKMVTKAGAQKLFGKDNPDGVDPEQEDEIQYADESKKTRYVNLKITGDAEDYKITLEKED
jgi:hypothetical protein